MKISNRVDWGIGMTAFIGSLIYAINAIGLQTPKDLAFGSPLTPEEQSLSRQIEGIQKALRGDYFGAMGDYDRALALSPNNPDIYYNRAVAYYSLGQSHLALEDFEHAIQLQPFMVEAYANRGTIRLEQGDTVGALSDVQKASELFEQQGQPHLATEIRNRFQAVQK